MWNKPTINLQTYNHLSNPTSAHCMALGKTTKHNEFLHSTVNVKHSLYLQCMCWDWFAEEGVLLSSGEWLKALKVFLPSIRH